MCVKRSLLSNIFPLLLPILPQLFGGGVNGWRRMEETNEFAVMGLAEDGDVDGMDGDAFNVVGDIRLWRIRSFAISLMNTAAEIEFRILLLWSLWCKKRSAGVERKWVERWCWWSWCEEDKWWWEWSFVDDDFEFYIQPAPLYGTHLTSDAGVLQSKKNTQP